MYQFSLAYTEIYLQVLSKFEQDMAQAVEAFSKEQKRANQAEKEKQIQVNFYLFLPYFSYKLLLTAVSITGSKITRRERICQ